MSSHSSCTGSTCSDGETCTSSSSGEPNLPYPGFPEISLKYLTQDTKPRNWCLQLITNPWFERISILVILLNCITLGMYQPCVDDECVTNRCKILQIFDDIIFVFFGMEMTIKMVAMGVYGKNTYLADSWNRLDFFIVLAGAIEYCLHVENLNLTAIRTIRVLRPLRAINRIPSMRILVMLLLDTLPMLGNVLLLCFFVFFIFGIVGVQLWEGILRQRCVLQLPNNVIPPDVSFYYEFSKEQDYICSKPDDSGMHLCNSLPAYRVGPLICNASAVPFSRNYPTNTSCVNWNQYYTNCSQLGGNPFQGTISFDNIGLAWVAIFLVISLEGWTDIMYYVQDAHSFWDWIYFVLLIVIGSFFMINLCLVVIATQFSETKKREMERMRQERARFTSTSTLASSTNNSEPTTCYAEIVKYIAHLWRRFKRRLIKKLRLYKYAKKQRREGLLPAPDILTLSPSKIKAHHPKCHKYGMEKATNIKDQQQLITVMVPLNSTTTPNNSTVVATTVGGGLNGGGNGAINGIESSMVNSALSQNVPNDGQVSSPDNSELSLDHSRSNSVRRKNINNNNGGREEQKQKTLLLKIPSMTESEQLLSERSNSGFLSPPISTRRRSSVMFNEYVILHTPPTVPDANVEKNVSEKMTQAGDGSIWQVNLQNTIGSHSLQTALVDCSDLSLNEAMTCQELLAFSVAFSAALPTGHGTLESFYTSLARSEPRTATPVAANDAVPHQNSTAPTQEDFSCCYEHYQNALLEAESQRIKQKSRFTLTIVTIYKVVSKVFGFIQKYVKRFVEHKYFQQGILLAILINTLSMGIEYHNQPSELTTIVETSNIVFSAIFALEMLLKIIAEGPFRYISNGFNVFDGVIVVLSVVELCQQFLGEREGNSGLSVLRTFRLLRILKLVRFMPNLRRQLLVMLRTMDNVAIFFSLLILFIFIFSILGMYLFGGKFCKFMDGTGQERECTCPEIVSKHPLCECDRKHFNNILWATVTVFQILTQEDWNVVLFNGMEKTSHWAALYFVALMTFGNYVLFNLLVAILVEGFSSERNERREREQRELVKKLREENLSENINDIYDDIRSFSESTTTSDSYQEMKNKWHSAEELRKNRDGVPEPKCNIQKQKLLQPKIDYSSDSLAKGPMGPGRQFERDAVSNSSFRVKPNKSHCEVLKLDCIKLSEPPTITTTAATPQDSPNTTTETGSSYKPWDDPNFDCADKQSSQQSIPSLLQPPSLLGSLKLLDEKVCPEHAGSSSISQTDLKSKIPKGLNCESTSDISQSQADEVKSSGAEAQQEGGGGTTFQRGSSFKRFNRSSSKRKKTKTRSESESGDVVLNNGHQLAASSATLATKQNNVAAQMRRSHPGLQAAHRIQNDTKDTSGSNNRLSPQNSIRRPSVSSLRRASCIYNNAHLYHNVGRRASSIKNYPSPNNRRRMSSIEHAYEKVSNINIYNFENQQRLDDPRTSKINLEILQKSISNIHIPANQESLSGQQIVHEEHRPRLKRIIEHFSSRNFTEERDDFSLYIFPPENKFRIICSWFVNQKWFDNVILLFIALNCITLAMERPNIPPTSTERIFLATANYIFTVVFTTEMFIKVVAAGMFYGHDAYFTSGWNIMDGSLVIISIVDLLMSLVSESSPRIFGILRVFRLLRSLRPLRVINRAPGLKLVVQTLLSSLRPIGNILLICVTFFVIFGILGVQLFKGTFYYCEGEHIKGVKNKTDCLSNPNNVWINRKYNFDDLGKALMSLFVLSSRDGWVNIMYTGLDAVGVDQQPIVNYNEWRLLYFIAFILLVGFFVLNMFVGVVVENFHRCREEQEKEEKLRRAAKRVKQLEKSRKRMSIPPYYTNYSPLRLFVHSVVTSKYFDLAIAAVIGLNVVTMAMEYYKMPMALEYALKIFNYFFTAVFILEAIMKLVALGIRIYLKDKWNQLDVAIVILSIVGIVLEELETNIIPINPTIIRVMRVLRIARVLKLLKMAKGIRALLDTVMQALPQVGNLGLLFFLLFFIFAALGVELFGRLECSDDIPCQGLGEHAHFANFGMAFLTLFRVATGDNWNGIMKDTLRDDCDDAADCVRNCCVSTVIAPIFFVIFVLMAQFVLVNVVVAVLMKHLEESHKMMEDEIEIDNQLEREFEKSQKDKEDQELCMQLESETNSLQKRPLAKVSSLPSNFTYSTPVFERRYSTQRRQTIQYFQQSLGMSPDIRNYNTAVFSKKGRRSTDEGDGKVNINGFEFADQQFSRGKYHKRKSWKPRLSQDRSFDEEPADEMRTAETHSTHDVPSLQRQEEAPAQRSASTRTLTKSHTVDREPELILLPENIRMTHGIALGDEKKLSDVRKSNPFLSTRSFSTDTGKSYLSVPKLQPRSRSGSTKQLFKQVAVEEDHDVDESTLLLPTIGTLSEDTAKVVSEKEGTDLGEEDKIQEDETDPPAEPAKKSDSTEILRIISERRRMERKDTDDSSGYNELLIAKSPESSTDI
ncbi:voltage-dependent T-type calcium channel subunit alpha-1G isoform X3 [Lutzomyia longipalpis]|uniref:voltage-dependent T-type calcium channel subunit alpha-1G isoform X3 n=1 Tax=Lutzomyia longipalpis TaxID=7200 RepID=UPI002484476A|nr:voltage-dependent T-type calcium channel subunit alpha-1G isoform X3 [Lutzomyia longipalpis]